MEFRKDRSERVATTSTKATSVDKVESKMLQEPYVTEEATRKYLGAPTFANSNALMVLRKDRSKCSATTSTMTTSVGKIENKKLQEPYRYTSERQVKKQLRYPTSVKQSKLSEYTPVPKNLSEVNDIPKHRKPISSTAARKYLGLPTFINHSEYSNTSNVYRPAVPQRTYVNMFHRYNGAPSYFDVACKNNKMLKFRHFSTAAENPNQVSSKEPSKYKTFLQLMRNSKTWMANLFRNTSKKLTALSEVTEDQSGNLEKGKDSKKRSSLGGNLNLLLRK